MPRFERCRLSLLGSIADARAIDALTAALKDMDAEVREHAARALGRIARGQRQGPGRFPVANLELKALEREIQNVQKVEIDKVHKQMAKVYQDLGHETNWSWSWGSLDPHEMVDAAMRQADKAFKQYEENWRQLEQGKGWWQPDQGSGCGGRTICGARRNRRVEPTVVGSVGEAQVNRPRSTPAAINEQIAALSATDPAARGLAACYLSGMGGRASAAVPALVRLLPDATPIDPIACRGDAFWGMGFNGPAKSSPGMEAARALGFIGEAALEPLLQVVGQNNPAVRRHTAHALAFIRAERSLTALLTLAKDPDALVRVGSGHRAWSAGRSSRFRCAGRAHA